MRPVHNARNRKTIMSDVLIAGAGPAGLTLAIELLRRKIPVRLIDASAEPFGGSRGKGVQPRSLEIFNMIGIIDDILAESSLYPYLKMHLGPISFKAGSLVPITNRLKTAPTRTCCWWRSGAQKQCYAPISRNWAAPLNMESVWRDCLKPNAA